MHPHCGGMPLGATDTPNTPHPRCGWACRCVVCVSWETEASITALSTGAAAVLSPIAHRRRFHVLEQLSPSHPEHGTPGSVMDVEPSEFDTLVDGTANVMVMVHTPWCGPCKAFRVGYADAAAHFSHSQDFRFLRLDATSDDAEAIAARYASFVLCVCVLLRALSVADSASVWSPREPGLQVQSEGLPKLPLLATG